MEAELFPADCFYGGLCRIFHKVENVYSLSTLQNKFSISRDRMCDGLELSCSYENKYRRPYDNGEERMKDDTDQDDDIFK